MNNWSLCRLNGPMVTASSFGVKADPPSFIRLNSSPSLFRSIRFKKKDAFHGPLLKVHCVRDIPFSSQRSTEIAPFSLIDPQFTKSSDRYYRSLSKLSDYEILGPGMIILRGYVSLKDQVDIVKICEKWAGSTCGFYSYNQSGVANRRQMCFGRNWEPEIGYKNPYILDGIKPPPVPYELISLAVAAIRDAQIHLDELPSMCPDTCLVSFYGQLGYVGLHQDRDESSYSLRRGLPVVTISIGLGAFFMYGHTRDKRKLKFIWLESGDILIFGGKSRLIYHEVRAIVPVSAEPIREACGLRVGRLSLTLRQF